MKTLAFFAAACVLGAASAAHAQSTFPDVPDNHWAAAAVKRLAELGILEGFPAPPARFNQSQKSETSAKNFAKTKTPAKTKAAAKSAKR